MELPAYAWLPEGPAPARRAPAPGLWLPRIRALLGAFGSDAFLPVLMRFNASRQTVVSLS